MSEPTRAAAVPTSNDATSNSDAEPLTVELALSPSDSAWRALTPGERLARSWAMRARLVDPQAVHDRKLFPAP